MTNNGRTPTNATPRKLAGRYALLGKIGAGGMGSVYLGKLVAAAGFERTVAVKRINPELVADAQALAMFRQEVRLAARIQHPNVPAALDVVEDGDELWLVMEYVHGAGLSLLMRESRGPHGLPPPIAVAIAIGMLNGLHAAHEATDADGVPLGIVHRDVSPQNVLVGCDGLARIIDFGVARATGQIQTTMMGQIKGKLAYLAPERLTGTKVDRRADVYGATIVLWEMLTGKRLFDADAQSQIIERALSPTIVAPRTLVPGISDELDAIVLMGLQKEPKDRFQTAREMALALSTRCVVASPHELADWVALAAAQFLEQRNLQLLAADTVKLTPHPVDETPQRAGHEAFDRELATPEETADRTVIAPIRPVHYDGRAPMTPSVVPVVYSERGGGTAGAPAVQTPLATWRSLPRTVIIRRGVMVLAACALLGLLAASQLGHPGNGDPSSPVARPFQTATTRPATGARPIATEANLPAMAPEGVPIQGASRSLSRAAIPSESSSIEARPASADATSAPASRVPRKGSAGSGKKLNRGAGPDGF